MNSLCSDRVFFFCFCRTVTAVHTLRQRMYVPGGLGLAQTTLPIARQPYRLFVFDLLLDVWCRGVIFSCSGVLSCLFHSFVQSTLVVILDLLRGGVEDIVVWQRDVVVLPVSLRVRAGIGRMVLRVRCCLGVGPDGR